MWRNDMYRRIMIEMTERRLLCKQPDISATAGTAPDSKPESAGYVSDRAAWRLPLVIRRYQRARGVLD